MYIKTYKKTYLYKIQFFFLMATNHIIYVLYINFSFYANPYEWAQLLTRTTRRRDYLFLSLFIFTFQIKLETAITVTIIY